MFRRLVGVGLGAVGGATVGLGLTLALLNSRLADLAQDSEGNLLVNDANIYWALLALGGLSGLLLGGYLGMRLTHKVKLTKEEQLKANKLLAAPEEFCTPVEAPVINPHKKTASPTASDRLTVNVSHSMASLAWNSENDNYDHFAVLSPREANATEYEPLLLRDEELPISIPPIVDLEAGRSATEQAKDDFQPNIKENYFLPNPSTQGGYGAFFAAASSGLSKARSPSAEEHDELDGEGWVLEFN